MDSASVEHDELRRIIHDVWRDEVHNAIIHFFTLRDVNGLLARLTQLTAGRDAALRAVADWKE